MRFRLNESALRFTEGVRLLAGLNVLELADDGLAVDWQEGSVLRVSRQGGTARIEGSCPVHFFRGLGLLLEGAEDVQEEPVFPTIGASFDLSRNGAMQPRALSRMLARLALMGYQQMYLYTEDTYQLEDYPFFGYLRGAYSEQELRQLDDQAASLGIELVPCIQTLGHLERFLHWESSAPLRDTPDVLLVGSEEVYQLIDAMMRQCRRCFRTDKIHIGMDEAMNLGLGRYLKQNGYRESFSIMLAHVNRVAEIARQYGFSPMMWSDMYFRCASPRDDYYEDVVEIPARVREAAPRDVALVYWDYYHADEAFYDRYLTLHEQFGVPLYFAGGMWTWLGPAPDYEVFFRNAAPALAACRKHGVQQMLLTSWGDDGAETSPQAMLLGLQAWAEYAYTGSWDDRAALARRLYTCTGADWDALLRLSAFHKTARLDPASDLPNGAKFLLYQDPLTGIYDADVAGLGFAEQYAALETEYAVRAEAGGQWQALYTFYAALARVLKNKAELGGDLCRAYQAGDRETLRRLAAQARQASADCGDLLEAWRVLWDQENRPFGFEVLEVRIAGVRSRLETAARRVEAWCAGELDELEELAAPRLPVLRKPGTDQIHGVYFWREITSACKAW